MSNCPPRRTAPSRRRCATSCRALSLTTAPWRAAAARTFREEGRLDDIAAHIRPGDLLVVSFGHNDANHSKAERYVPADAFGESLRLFWDAARNHGAGASLPPPWRCASLTRPVFSPPLVCRLPRGDARLCRRGRRAIYRPWRRYRRRQHRLWRALQGPLYVVAQSRTTPTSKTPAPAARHRLLCSSFCRIPPRHWMCCG